MVKIVTDSVASIPSSLLREQNVEMITLYINREGVEYADSELDLNEFYAELPTMIDNLPTSSQPSQHALEKVFEAAAQNGDDILGVFLSSGLSGTFDGAVRAARAVKSRNINFCYALVDSNSAGYDEAFPVFEAAAARDRGEDLASCTAAVLASIESSRFLFTPENLTYLQKGGRIGNAAALLGNLIQLAPVLTVIDGKATTFAKVRTRKKALDKMIETLKKDIEEHGLKNIVVHYIGQKQPALEWARTVVEPLVGRAVDVLPVSPVIGLHVGPAVGIAYECCEAIQNKVTAPLKSLVVTA